MPRHERSLGFDGPVAIGGVDVCMANSTGFDLNQHLSILGLRDREFPDGQWLAELGDECSFHCLWDVASDCRLEGVSGVLPAPGRLSAYCWPG